MQTANGAIDVSLEGNLPMCSALPVNLADGTLERLSNCGPSAPNAAPRPVTPAELPGRPTSRPDLLRRVLTSPWRLLVPPRAAPANWERSCHAFGTNPSAINTASAAVNRDALAPGRVDRRSTASAASHRSLFTVDGLPEVPAPDPSVLSLHLDPPRPLSNQSHPAGGRNGDNGSSRSAVPHPHQLQHAATDISTLLSPPQTAHPCMDQIQIEIQIQDSDPDRAVRPYTVVQRGGANSSAASGSTGHGWGNVAADTPHRSCQVADRGAVQPLLAPLPTDRHPQQLPMHLLNSYGIQDPQQQQLRLGRLQQPLPHPPQQQQPLLAPLAMSETTTGLLGPMHRLLQLPGATDTFVHKARQYEPSQGPPPPLDAGTASAEPLLVMMPQRSDGASTAQVATTAAASPPAGVLEAVGTALWPGLALSAPPAPSPCQIDPNDVRNPMSFEYDPSLDLQRQHQHLQPRQQQNGTGLSYGEPRSTHGSFQQRQSQALEVLMGTAGSGGVRPERKAAADDDGRTMDAPPGGDGNGGGAEVVASNGPFVVLEMKGPRGTPSTHAAAAAAFLSGASASLAAPAAAAAAAGMSLTLRGRMTSYFSKWRGVGDTLMPADHPVDVFWSWLGSFLSILVVAVLNQYLTPHVSLPLMIASFGASAVLLFGVPASKLAQPRNFLGGQVVSAAVGVLIRLAFMKAPNLVWMSAALGMSLALAAMQITRTVHPPGGASALIASSALYIGPWYGFKFVLTVFFGCVAMLAVAVVVNNLSARRRYPTYWLGK